MHSLFFVNIASARDNVCVQRYFVRPFSSVSESDSRFTSLVQSGLRLQYGLCCSCIQHLNLQYCNTYNQHTHTCHRYNM